MLNKRLIPCLQLIDGSLVKTRQFGKFTYVGDPVNTARIFNELEVDELCLIDIRATCQHRQPPLTLLQELASECFMPLSYGGGVRSVEAAGNILSLGVEKILINTAAHEVKNLVPDISRAFGSQSLIVSMDLRRDLLGRYSVYTRSGRKKISGDPLDWARHFVELGAGELFVTVINREGTWKGLDLNIIERIARAVSVPVIAHGGVGSVQHINEACSIEGISAVAVGSLVVFQREGCGILVNYPDRRLLSPSLRGVT